MPREQNTTITCERCGTCCIKGGPALHYADKKLLLDELLKPDQLVTVRKGEPALFPAAEKPQPALSEFLKIKGKPASWTCIFFEEHEARCLFYEHRPLECSLLKCWDTSDLEKVAGCDLLNRFDIIKPDDPVLAFIKTHEKECSLTLLPQLLAQAEELRSQQQALADLQDLANRDLAVRAQACRKLNCDLDLELFFFGRPVFLILEQCGFTIYERNGLIHLG